MKIGEGGWKTFGFEPIKKILELQVGSGTLPHAYLFAGPEGIGKKTLALELARYILETDRLENHPDFSLLDKADDSSELSLESVLDFISQLRFKPFVAAYKVAVINHAELLNTSSGNALLKTLEEPSSRTIVILVSSQQSVLATIRSRCQCFSFQPFTPNQLRQYAAQEGMDVTDAMITYSFGSIGRLKKLCTEKHFFTEQQEQAAVYTRLAEHTPVSEKLLAIGPLAELETEELQETLQLWCHLALHRLSQHPESFASVEAISQSLLDLSYNKNKKLILQTLLLKI